MSTDIGTEIVRRYGLFIVGVIAAGIVLFLMPLLSGNNGRDFPIEDPDTFMKERAELLEDVTGLKFHTLPKLVIVEGREDLTRIMVARARLNGSTKEDEEDIRVLFENALAIYSPEEHQIVARTRMMGDGDVVASEDMAAYVLTHELVHALDALHFAAVRELPSGIEAQKVRRALVEGHAVFVTAQVYEGWKHQLLSRFVAGSRESLNTETAAYWQGGRFFAALHERGGNDLVLQALRHPPETMDVILNPSLYR